MSYVHKLLSLSVILTFYSFFAKAREYTQILLNSLTSNTKAHHHTPSPASDLELNIKVRSHIIIPAHGLPDTSLFLVYANIILPASIGRAIENFIMKSTTEFPRQPEYQILFACFMAFIFMAWAIPLWIMVVSDLLLGKFLVMTAICTFVYYTVMARVFFTNNRKSVVKLTLAYILTIFLMSKDLAFLFGRRAIVYRVVSILLIFFLNNGGLYRVMLAER